MKKEKAKFNKLYLKGVAIEEVEEQAYYGLKFHVEEAMMIVHRHISDMATQTFTKKILNFFLNF